ncbi:MAG: HpcH/HpaI aldolase/citrate lyase family protein [Verrucomicrobiota bacterium]|nr:HpcH/HpaI aldolase/citrate lyase family protein [Verrucomicrobiota bacterium]
MNSKTSLQPNELDEINAALGEANQAFMRRYPGESNRRQAVHTVYGGAHLFKADSAQKIGAVALRSLQEYAPDAATLARALGVGHPDELSQLVYDRVIEKLRREPVEDFRLDFEDGYGNRPETEEDAHAESAAAEVARGLQDGTLPPFLGIRIKPLNEDLRVRSMRTLDIFITALTKATEGKLPPNFVVTVPKIQLPEQVAAAVRLFAAVEKKTGLTNGALRLEPMIETPQAILNQRGEIALQSLVEAAAGRCGSVHFGVYDYTANCGITAAYQTMGHPACDFARQIMLVSLAGTGIHLSDGATNILPVGPQRASEGHPLTASQFSENRAAVHAAWRLGFNDNMHSLRTGFYQGWDLHPAQLVTRYAAVFTFFLEGLESASNRLKTFVEKAALASLFGDVFDDAATGQGLLNFFLRGIACGAISEAEALATGLTIEEIRSRSFLKILQWRRNA